MVLQSETPQPDDRLSPSGEAVRKKPLLSSRTRILITVLIVISFVTATASTGWEVLHLAKIQAKDKMTGHLATTREAQVRGPLPPVHPTHFFPRSVTGYTVFGRQKVRGEEDYAAEAIFKPEDEQYSFVEPLNVYAKIAYYGSGDDAQKAIDRLLGQRKATDQVDIEVHGISANAGYTADRGSLIIAWGKDGYAVEIDASYTQMIPTERTDALEKNAIAVAKAIQAKMSGSGGPEE